MIVSRNWLQDYVQLPSDTAEWSGRLTMSGLNLEEFHDATGLITDADTGSHVDVAVDLEVTSNRADCLGHIGIAREISVLYGVPLTIPAIELHEATESAATATSVDIQCPDLCHEYHARVMRGVRIGPSPTWLKNRLAAVGVNSVNNVVDVTNYVMLECGQPLHAFDFDKLNQGRVVVRKAVPGETITAIDQRSYALNPDMCVIADATRPVAVAGVMGGLDTEISDSTVNILIETASFSSLSVRATARQLKLHSPSSYRFERRVDRQQLDWASRRCCQLIQQIAGGEVLTGSVVCNPSPAMPPAPVVLRFAQVRRLLGIEVPAATCVSILTQLGLQCSDQNEVSATFTAPSWRPDLTRECDLIEEVARIHGYDQIPTNAAMPVLATSRTAREQVTDLVRQHLTGCGFYEALTLSFVSEQQVQQFHPRGEIAAVAVNHSSRSHENHLRQSLIPSLLQCRRQNERHGTANAELFEVAKVYLSAGEGRPERQAEPAMAGIVSGRTFLQLKGCVEKLVQLVNPGANLETIRIDAAEFRPDRGAQLFLDGVLLGWIGELSPAIADQVDLQDNVTVAELDVETLLAVWKPHRHATPLPRFPSISRDLNLLLPEAVSWSDLAATVREAGGALLGNVEFAGQYRGKQIAADRKSYVVSCRFLAPDRTLTTDEVDQAVNQILTLCSSRLNADLRA